MFKSRLAEEENKWREEGDHQPQKKTMLENVRSQVLFKELEGKSKYIETLQKRLVNGRVKEQAQISGLQADLDKTEADLVKANEAHKVTKKQVQDLILNNIFGDDTK